MKGALAGGGFPRWAGAGNGSVSLTESSKKSQLCFQACKSSPAGSGPAPVERDKPPPASSCAGSGWQCPLAQLVPQGPREGDPVQEKKEGKQLTENCKTQESELGLGGKKNLVRFCKKVY